MLDISFRRESFFINTTLYKIQAYTQSCNFLWWRICTARRERWNPVSHKHCERGYNIKISRVHR